MSTKSNASSGVSAVFSPEKQRLISDLQQKLANAMNIYYSNRQEALSSADDIIFYLTQCVKESSYKTEQYLEDEYKVSKYGKELAQRIKDEQAMMKIVYDSTQKLNAQQVVNKLNALNSKLEAIENRKNKAELESDLNELQGLLQQVVQMEGITFTDKKALISNTKKTIQNILTHKAMKIELGNEDEFAAVGVTREISDQYNAAWSQFINSASQCLYSFGSGLGSVASNVGLTALAVTRNTVIPAKQLVGYGASGIQIAIQLLASVINDNKTQNKDKNVSELLDALNNFDPDAADLVTATIALSPPSQGSSGMSNPNLLLLDNAFEVSSKSNNSSIASSLVSSQSSTPDMDEQIDVDIEFPQENIMMKESINNSPLVNSPLSESARLSVSSQQSVVASISSLREYKNRILSLQQSIQNAIQNNSVDSETGSSGTSPSETSSSEKVDIGKEAEDLTAHFSPVDNSLQIENSRSLRREFIEMISEESQDETEDSQQPKRMRVGSTNSSDYNFGGRKRKTRQNKNSHNTKRRGQKGGKKNRKTKKGKKQHKTLKRHRGKK